LGSVIGQVLPFAIAIALSPFPIIGLILILFTKQARTNSLVFTLGWIVGLAVVAAIIWALFSTGRITAGSDSAESGASLITLLLGLALLFLAWRQWQSRPKPGEPVKTPKWMATTDSITTPGAFGLGFLLSGVNPKNLILNIGAALTIAQAPLDSTETLIVVIIYLLLASVSVIALVVYYQVAGAGAENTLNDLRAWLIQNNTAVMAVLLLVFGVKFVGDFLTAYL
jgi:hypothetical protein